MAFIGIIAVNADFGQIHPGEEYSGTNQNHNDLLPHISKYCSQ
jgi:hypothetical protein